ncbi:uncharacterized protein LOC111601056 isoform X2 [Drosophila hydei]|uniref:Uncharacterized protein LOC111601056 isoform X2 n=1 Tax=Drosophila hydei TaxID=7224 RepID=A0A6J1M4K9_DROHY|nr:uncharacterized protein LOC111601056 isoform X2 [Drosophila hydei]
MERFPKIAALSLRNGFQVLCANVRLSAVRYLKSIEFHEQNCPTKQSFGPRCKGDKKGAKGEKEGEKKGEKKSKKKDDKKLGAKSQKKKDSPKDGQKDPCKKK